MDGALSCVTYIRDSVPGIRDSRGVHVARAAVDTARAWARGAARSLITKVDTKYIVLRSRLVPVAFVSVWTDAVWSILNLAGYTVCEHSGSPTRAPREKRSNNFLRGYRLESSRRQRSRSVPVSCHARAISAPPFDPSTLGSDVHLWELGQMLDQMALGSDVLHEHLAQHLLGGCCVVR